MTVNLINIGNSKGLILPQALLKRLKISSETVLEIESTDDYILIKKAQHRAGWVESAKKMNLAEDDLLLIKDSPTHFEDTEWTW